MKKEKVPSIISLAILTLITSVLWIFFSLYRVFTEKPSPKVPDEIVAPFSPTLNEEVISEIENRVFIEQNQMPDSIVKKEATVVATESASPIPEPTNEETNTGTPLPTSTGGLEGI